MNAVDNVAVAPAPAIAELAPLLGGAESPRAEAGLLAVLHERPGDGPAANSLIPHLIRTGRGSDAVDLARSHLIASQNKPQPKVNIARLLLAEALAAQGLGEAAEAAPSAEDLADVWSAQLRRAALMIQLGLFEEAAISCKAARNAMPIAATATQMIRLVKLARRARDHTLAADLAAQATEGDIGGAQQASLLSLRADSLFSLGRYVEAYEPLAKAAAISEDEQLGDKALWVARYHGDAEMLARAREQQVLRGRQRLPESLADGLGAIKDGPIPPLSAIPEHMAIPWKAAALPDSNWPDWAARFFWGEKASALLRDWIRFAGEERQDQLESILLPVEDTALRRAVDSGGGVIIAGSHLGSPAALFPYLLRLPSQLAIVAGGKSEIRGVEGFYVPQRGRSGTIRAVRARLQQGGMVALAVDMVRKGSDARIIGIGGGSLSFSPLVARLSRAWLVPSFWIQPEWCEGKIRLRLASLPEPDASEGKTQWEQRWFDAFSGNLLEFLRTCSPESACGLRVETL